ncbi:hypothetical protein WISP_55279 [Willisornis vidua]|uniref:Uncharacterized protein n=1 Tax=Willisornis vidua TaxID=1566151 RepID=A0ABQ9DHE7_9PASS|nr:hypothetical protein WISP_55279 [Willisornis vidua]
MSEPGLGADLLDSSSAEKDLGGPGRQAVHEPAVSPCGQECQWDNGVKAIENLMQRRGKFDYILLETTGLADPGIVSVVDAKHGLQHLTEEKPEGLVNEASRQVALADLIIINKTDLVSEEELNKVRTYVRSINGLVKILETQRSRVDLSNVLDLHAFDSLSGISLQKKLEHVKTTHAHLDKAIITVTFEVPGNIKEENLNLFIQNLLWEKNVKDKTGHTMDVIRLKGLVSIQGKSHQVIVQGVHELYDLEETSVAWKENEKRTNRLVLIAINTLHRMAALLLVAVKNYGSKDKKAKQMSNLYLAQLEKLVLQVNQRAQNIRQVKKRLARPRVTNFSPEVLYTQFKAYGLLVTVAVAYCRMTRLYSQPNALHVVLYSSSYGQAGNKEEVQVGQQLHRDSLLAASGPQCTLVSVLHPPTSIEILGKECSCNRSSIKQSRMCIACEKHASGSASALEESEEGEYKSNMTQFLEFWFTRPSESLISHGTAPYKLGL